jgi:hypothetical protein
MAYRLAYSDYSTTTTGPPDPERWVGPPGPPGVQGPIGPVGPPGPNVVPSDTVPLMDGAGAAGTATTQSRGDHTHPSDTSRLPLTGGTLTGRLTLATGPTVALDAATKGYVDTTAANYLPLVGGSVTGATTFSGAGTGLAVTNAATVGGTLGVTGALTAPVSTSTAIATGGTTARTVAARLVDTINVLDMGVSGAAVDRTGVTDASGAIQAAINLALAGAPQKTVYIPAGTYLMSARALIVANTNGLTIRGDPGETKLLLDPVSNANAALIGAQGNTSNITIENMIFDGNTGNNTTNMFSLVGPASPSLNWTFRNCTFQNSNATAINSAGEALIAVTLNATANAGQAVLSVASVPATVKPGAFVVGSGAADPNMYVISTTATTITLNRNLPDTALSGAGVSFCRAFTTNADALYGATVLTAADTSGLSVGQSLACPPTSGALQTATRITAITTNVSVTIDKPLLCKLPSGSNVAAAGGHTNLRVESCKFLNIGQMQIANLARSYNTVGAQGPGTTLTLRCRSASGGSQAGVFPGQKIGPAPPANVPPVGTLIVDGVTVNNAANTFTVTLASPLTGTVPDNTAIPFMVSNGGQGYGVWLGYGAPFANINAKFLNNYFEHTWAACIWAVGSGGALLSGNHYVQDQMQYRDPVIAASPCINLQSSMNARVIGDIGTGASGCGIEAEHPMGLIISGGEFSRNGACGIGINGGMNVSITGVICNNNGQYRNIPFVQDYETTFKAVGGIVISGSATTGQPGTATNFNIGRVIVSDTQLVPTQTYGIRNGYTAGAFVNLNLTDIIGSGNITALVDPAFP